MRRAGIAGSVLSAAMACCLCACGAGETEGDEPSGRLAASAGCDLAPEVRARVAEIYAAGRRNGLRARRFSKVGDSITASMYFLKGFECEHLDGSTDYVLDDPSLEAELAYFAGSFCRDSFAAKGGWSSAVEQMPKYSDPSCLDSQGQKLTPLDCEYDRWRPAFALIMLGTNDAINELAIQPTTWNPDKNYTQRMRWILDLTIERGVVPLLSTVPQLPWAGYSGDKNLQPYVDQINKTVRALAAEYQVPLVDFNEALRSLPNRGLCVDGIHPSWDYATQSVDLTRADRYGFTLRNLLTLRQLASVRACLAAAAPRPSPGPGTKPLPAEAI